eukprot:687880-Lingulodinium_polyedra.AAC.1
MPEEGRGNTPLRWCAFDPPSRQLLSNEGNGAARAAWLRVGGRHGARVCLVVKYFPNLNG